MKKQLILCVILIIMSLKTTYSQSSEGTDCEIKVERLKSVVLVIDTTINGINKMLQIANDRLQLCEIVMDGCQIEKNELVQIQKDTKEALIKSQKEAVELQRKLTRTRKIGIIGTVGGLIVGVLAVL